MIRSNRLGSRLLACLESLLRKLGLTPSEAPSTEELEWLGRARQRVLMVIQMRWVILASFAAYGLYAIFLYRRQGAPELSTLNKTVPIVAFLLTGAYNAWYHWTYRWFARIRHLNLIQILLDMAVVSMIVHFSGGVVSWFWAMYLVLILEAAFLGDRGRDVWIIGIASALVYGAVLSAERLGWIATVEMPFENSDLQVDSSYLLLKWAWVALLCLLVSGIAAHLIKKIRVQDRSLREAVITDSLTRLYNRRYFYLRLNSEIQRGKRYGRRCSLVILDVDDFKKINDTWGHQVGDQLLEGLAGVLRSNVRYSDTRPRYSIDLPCRIGGEEFAIILPEATAAQGGQAAERLRSLVEAQGAVLVAERVRKQVEALDFNGRRITVSVGVAGYPEHGEDFDTLFRAADSALYRAKARGRNRVELAEPDAALAPR